MNNLERTINCSDSKVEGAVRETVSLLCNSILVVYARGWHSMPMPNIKKQQKRDCRGIVIALLLLTFREYDYRCGMLCVMYPFPVPFPC